MLMQGRRGGAVERGGAAGEGNLRASRVGILGKCLWQENRAAGSGPVRSDVLVPYV